jgi:hypothetical protein
MRRVLVPFSVAPSSSAAAAALQSAAACCCAAVQISELSGLHYFLLQSTTNFRVRLLSSQLAFLPLHHHGISTALITQKEGGGEGACSHMSSTPSTLNCNCPWINYITHNAQHIVLLRSWSALLILVDQECKSPGSPVVLCLCPCKKYFSHPSLVIYFFFQTQSIKLKLGLQLCRRLVVLTTHLDQSN